MSDIRDLWGDDGKTVQMWAVPVHDSGECETAMKSDATHEHVVDFRGLYGFPNVRTVHIKGTMPGVYEAARQRLLGTSGQADAGKEAGES